VSTEKFLTYRKIVNAAKIYLFYLFVFIRMKNFHSVSRYFLFDRK